VACLIAEPLQGVGGFVVPPDGFFGALKQVLDEYGALFVSDEVQTGWGRTGEHFWGFQAHGVTPDLITFAKGLGNGMAIAGVAGRPEIVDSLQARSISTFGGNQLATTAALANLEYLLSHDLQANAKAMGALLLHGLRQLQERFEVIRDVRGKGLMIGVELVEPSTGLPSPAATNLVLEESRARGLLIGKGGLYGNVLRVAPPLCVTQHEVEGALAIFGEAFRLVAGDLGATGRAGKN
jgi:4-aminobutyrate aminotransferase